MSPSPRSAGRPVAGPRRIVVGLDGSPEAERALDWAIGIAQACGSELIAVHALGLLDRSQPDGVVPSATHREEIIHRFERSWCASLVGSGVRSRRVTREGAPLDVLLAVAEHDHADLIVVGSRGIGRVPGQVLGSTSHQVATRARTPVVVVPAGR